jgi:uncharacterized protein
MPMTPLPAAQYRRAPWRNGGGMTDEVANDPNGDWQIGYSDIERDGPFSDYSGFDRCLTLVAGHGVVLTPSAEPAMTVATRWRPQRFPGEWPIECRRIDGPCRVLNVTTRRGAIRSMVEIRALDGDGEALEVAAGEPTVILALAGSMTADDGAASVVVHAGDGFRTDFGEPATIRISGERATFALVRLTAWD